ncbi:MAG TPA: hypothetical protein PLN94_15560, partial [Thiolinea sp.]|nr:hypothetical protein [Thiolinea sp.]
PPELAADIMDRGIVLAGAGCSGAVVEGRGCERGAGTSTGGVTDALLTGCGCGAGRVTGTRDTCWRWARYWC